jgi:AcrR family transcriptional regulator
VARRLTREQQKERTREELLSAAARVFAQKGYEGASIDDVAAEAGFTKGAFYSNFASKDDVFIALVEDRSRNWTMAAARAYEGHVVALLEPVEALLARPIEPRSDLRLSASVEAV